MSTITVTDWTTTQSITTGDDEPVAASKRRIVVNSLTFAAMTVGGLLDFAEGLRRSGLPKSATVRPTTRDGRLESLTAEHEDRVTEEASA